MVSRSGLDLIIVGHSAACGLVVEIVAGRMIAPYLGMSLYTWTAIISVVLAGFSVGHWVGGLWAEKPTATALRRVAWSLLAAGFSTAASLIIIRTVVPVLIAQGWSSVPTVLAVTLVLFFLPSLFVGIPSPVLTKLAVDASTPGRAGRTIGAFFAVGAVGSIIGTLAAGFIFIAWLGTTKTLLLVALAYLVMGLVLFFDKRADGPKGAIVPALAVVLGGVVSAGLGNHVQAFTEPCRIGSSYYCIRTVDVSREYGTEARLMVLDHLGHGVNVKDEPGKLVSPYVELQDTLARIHSGRHSPFRVFFIGGGTYTLPRAWAAARPDAQVTVAEIDPEVTRIAETEFWLGRSDRIATMPEDARTALQKFAPDRFDVIIGDAFHDIVIPAHLVTHEFFVLVRSRLKPNGIYLMNVVDHRLRPRLALSILESMKAALGNVEIWASNEAGARATFVLAGGLQAATPYAALPSRNNPGVRFLRVSPEKLELLSKRVRAMVLSDDYAPVDWLIGVE